MNTDPLFDVSGRRVLVTGGLGQLGTEFVRAFQSRGAVVYVASRSVTAAALEAHFGDTANLMPLRMDITDADDVRGRLRAVASDGGPVTVVVNNAGLDTQPSAPPEVPDRSRTSRWRSSARLSR